MQKPSLLAARLRHRVIIEQMQRTSDGAGGSSVSWSEVDIVWAAVEPLSTTSTSRERFNDNQLQTTTRYKITLRYRNDVTADMRLVLGSRIFDIKSIINPGERNEVLEILVES